MTEQVFPIGGLSFKPSSATPPIKEPLATEAADGALRGAYERGIHDASIWLRDQQHQNPPESLWQAAAILADRMNIALLPARTALADCGEALSTAAVGGER